METLWNELSLIADSPEVMAERTSPEAAELQADRLVAFGGGPAPGRKSRMRTALPWAMAASVLLAILVGTALVLRPVPEGPAAAFATSVARKGR